MDQNDEKNPSFPEGYAHVEARLNETIELLQQIDRQIETVPQDSGPVPTLNPPGTVNSQQPGSRDRKISFLKDQKDRIKADTWEKTEAETQNGDNRTIRVVRDTVREELFPNRFRRMDKGERIQEKAKDNDLDTWQDIMDAEIVDSAAGRNAVPEQHKPAPEHTDKADMSMSARFSLSLGYTRMSEKAEKSLNPSPDRQPDKDRD